MTACKVLIYAALAVNALLSTVNVDAKLTARLPYQLPDDGTMDILSRLEQKSHRLDRSGENHKTPPVPNGASLVSLPVGHNGAKVAAYWSNGVDHSTVEHAFIMMHGRVRNGAQYWKIMNNALNSAQSSGAFPASKGAVVVAPEMYSAALNKGQYDNQTLAWGAGNAWISGAVAVHPEGTNLTSMDALDAFVDHFSNSGMYPNMRNITLVGHGGGGQLMNRYAATGKDATSKNIYVRYVVGDPSSSPYFTTHRPVPDTDIANKATCPGYNTWRYGFHQFPGTLDSSLRPVNYFARYINRDVINIVGLEDVDVNNGDQSCMAVLQGGHQRRQRNLSWWKYINLLARSGDNLAGFPGTFNDLPNWSHTHNGKIKTRLAVVEDASHNAEKIFSSSIGRSALFNDFDVEIGWRPADWIRAERSAANGSSSAMTTTSSARHSSASSIFSAVTSTAAASRKHSAHRIHASHHSRATHTSPHQHTNAMSL
ncbi:hypothetical protein MYAM1_001229 [Malassezia yamatoensis]|uniref:Transmembrane protein n=1 Tax=Malassezia yamatoensis TaxID=253288 RepID=A0AAJ6CI54_9BASI|nr:hypothetical protein MYAM1_001229 [Malassezia yamatoensis]